MWTIASLSQWSYCRIFPIWAPCITGHYYGISSFHAMSWLAAVPWKRCSIYLPLQYAAYTYEPASAYSTISGLVHQCGSSSWEEPDQSGKKSIHQSRSFLALTVVQILWCNYFMEQLRSIILRINVPAGITLQAKARHPIRESSSLLYISSWSVLYKATFLFTGSLATIEAEPNSIPKKLYMWWDLQSSLVGHLESHTVWAPYSCN